jgi:hypothetical protein
MAQADPRVDSHETFAWHDAGERVAFPSKAALSVGRDPAAGPIR